MRVVGASVMARRASSHSGFAFAVLMSRAPRIFRKPEVGSPLSRRFDQNANCFFAYRWSLTPDVTSMTWGEARRYDRSMIILRFETHLDAGMDPIRARPESPSLPPTPCRPRCH